MLLPQILPALAAAAAGLLMCQVGGAAADPRGACLSCGRAAQTDVRGNLGPASVLTSNAAKDWLKDRWQSAKDMSGSPIPGAHWVTVELDATQPLHTVVLDWETAYADAWVLSARRPGTDAFEPVFDRPAWGKRFDDCHRCQLRDGATADAAPKAVFDAWAAVDGEDGQSALASFGYVRRERTHISGHAHVVDTVRLPDAAMQVYDGLRLDIARPGTRWGASLWRVAAFGGQAPQMFEDLDGTGERRLG